jgi:hypothetical protein
MYGLHFVSVPSDSDPFVFKVIVSFGMNIFQFAKK